MRIEDEQTGGIIFLGIERLCPAHFLYIKEGVKKQKSAPSMQVRVRRLAERTPKAKEQSYVFSPTEKQQKSRHQLNYKKEITQQK
ncbi:MAG: hypothetical protein IKY09_05460 [Methanocorpusculum sp.]|nr:hypothetical protein [Methanocorpusculum sp.]